MRTIGVFDSGVGGVSVLKEVLKEFPNDNIIYFGDSLNAPYGDRSIEEIRNLCLKVSDFLVFNKKVDAIVIACNTATGAGMEIMKKKYPIPVVGVVNNGAKKALELTKNNKIGVIATPATVNMKVYPMAIHKISSLSKVYQSKCPLFVEMIENGWVDNFESDSLIKEYLSFLPKDIDTLILGCTHYPLIREYLEKFYNGNIIDPAKETAISLKKIIGDSPKTNEHKNISFYVTGDVNKFKKVAGEFLGTPITNIEKVIL